MAFWGEKFKRPDEEDIWSELKQMLANSDVYEEQKRLKESRELEAFNKAWDKANGVNEKDIAKNGVLAGGATGIEETPLLQGYIEKTDKNTLTLGEKIFDKILQNKITTRGHFPIAADMYTDARTDFSRARADKNATILENMKELDSKTVNALEKYGIKPNERGIYYNENSKMSQKFGKSRELKKAFDKNIEALKNGTFNGEDLNFDARLIDAFRNKDKFDRHSSIQHAKLIDAYIDELGRKHGRFIDNYDFNKRPDSLKNLPNNLGYNLQEKGALENYFTIMDIIIEDDDWLDKLRKKLGI